MQSSFRRSENLQKLLTTFTLSIYAIGLLFVPEKLGIVTEKMFVWTSVLLGLVLYIAGLLNQISTFINYKLRIQLAIDMLVALCLGTLAVVHFQAALVIDGIVLMALLLSQLYLLICRVANIQPFDNIYLPAYAILLTISGGVLLFGHLNFFAHTPQRNTEYILGVLFILGGAASFTSFRLLPNRITISRILFNFSAIPWILWIILSFLESKITTTLVTLGLAIFPLIMYRVSWDKLALPLGDLIGHKIVYIASTIEFTILLTLFAIGHNTQNLPFSHETLYASSVLIKNQGFSFVTMIFIKGLTWYGLITVALTIRRLMLKNSLEENVDEDGNASHKGWSRWIARSIKSLTIPSQNLQTLVEIQEEQIAALTHQLNIEKNRTIQLNLLAELSHQLETQLDQPVAAQLAVNTLQRALDCKHIAVFENEIERREFHIIASAGTAMPPGYRQNTSEGLLGRTLRLRKTQIANDANRDPDFIQAETSHIKSAFAIPLIYHGHVRAILEVGDDKLNAFESHDVHLAELVTAELIRAWERSSYHQRLTNLIKAGIALSPLLESQTTINEIAAIAREILQARFVFVTLVDQENKLSRTAYSGIAPRLLNSLNQNRVKDTTIQAALNAHEVFRIRDVRKYRKTSQIEIDHNGLRSLLAIPIRLHRLSIGAIFAFGKQRGIFFSENDESLASLLSSEAATAIEATWLYQELRSTLKTTTQLYNLSVEILQAEGLHQAAQHIAETTAKMSNATVTGIILFTKDQKIETDIIIDASGAQPDKQHPLDLVQQTLESGQTVHVTPDQVSATICFPLQTRHRKYGALWLEVPKIQDYFAHNASNMQTLANQAILALERSILLAESQQQAQTIETAYEELEYAYDRTLAALISALDARDRETEGHSIRVSEIVCLLGNEMGLDAAALKTLERGSLLHDIGKIGISDTILHKPAELSKDEWKIMRKHPDIGARIIEEIPFLQDTLPIIRYHQERWDGSGYPVGLSGKDIPLQARIFAIVDAFDALINDRPYRRGIAVNEAMDYLREQAGALFDPDIVSAFEKVWKENELEDLIE